MNTERNWHWVDWFISVLRLCWFLTGTVHYYLYPENLEGLPYYQFMIVVSAAYVLPHIFWRPGYINRVLYPISEFLTTGLLFLYLNLYLQVNPGVSIILMSVLMVGYLSTKKTAPFTFPIFLVLLPLSRLWSTDEISRFIFQYVDILIFFGVGLSFNFMIYSQLRSKRLLRENMQQYELIREQNKILEQYAKQIENLTLYEERNRLARELHDTIGHHFTSVTVGLDAARFLVDADPEKAKKQIEALANVSREGLREIRQNIHQIAPAEDNQPLSLQLQKIAENFALRSGISVQFQIKGIETPTSKQEQMTFIRCLQEAITNAVRHGNATEITISMTFKNEELILQIINNGEQIAEILPGFGLKAMQERLQQLKGTLAVVNSEDRGVVLTCTIPKGEMG